MCLKNYLRHATVWLFETQLILLVSCLPTTLPANLWSFKLQHRCCDARTSRCCRWICTASWTSAPTCPRSSWCGCSRCAATSPGPTSATRSPTCSPPVSHHAPLPTPRFSNTSPSTIASCPTSLSERYATKYSRTPQSFTRVQSITNKIQSPPSDSTVIRPCTVKHFWWTKVLNRNCVMGPVIFDGSITPTITVDLPRSTSH